MSTAEALLAPSAAAAEGSAASGRPGVRAYAPRIAPHAYLDARAWVWCSPTYRALDHVFAIRTDDPSSVDYLEAVFAELVTDQPAVATYSLMDRRPRRRATYALYVDQQRLCVVGTRSRALSTLLWHVNQEAVRSTAARCVQWHAAAAVRDGVCVVLPAPMESGKTTTVAGLLRAGYQYLTDETVAVDPDTLLVHPFPKALSVDDGSWPVLPDLEPALRLVDNQWQVPPGQIRTNLVAPPTRPRLVVAPHFRRHAMTTLEPLRRSHALALVAQSTFLFKDDPRRNLEVSARVLASCECYRLVIGDLDAAVDAIDGLVDAVLADRP